MNRPHSYRPYSDPESDMYDDSHQASAQTYYRSSPPQDRQDSRKDLSRAPYGGEATDRMGYSDRADRDNDNGHAPRYNRRDDGSRSPRRDERRRYNDRDREGYRSPGFDRNRSRSRSPRARAPPNRTIILEGLPLNLTQEDGMAFVAFASDLQIFNELQHNLKVEGLEEIRLIKDKKTGLSRQFCFAEFKSLANATVFMDNNHSSITLYGPYNPNDSGTVGGTEVRIAYGREKEKKDRPGEREDDWKCDICYLSNYGHRIICFRCSAPRTRPMATGAMGAVTQANMSQFSGFATTGDSDVSPDNTASQFLLLRGLEPGVNEELLAKGVTKLYKTPTNTSNTETPALKKAKIVSTSSDTSLGAKEGSLRRVLLVRDRKSNDSWRYGFAEFNTVDDAQAAMAKYTASDKFTISSKPVMISYIHAGVFVPVLHAPAPEFEQFTFSPLSNPSVKLMYWDEAGYVNELVTARDEKSGLAKAKEALNAKLAAAGANEGLLGSSKDGDAKIRKRKAEKDASSSSKKVIAPHLQFWSNRHAELHGLPPKDSNETEEDDTHPVKTKKEEQKDDAPPSQSFADMNRKCCLLCSRQFKTDIEVNKHERTSQLHRDNMTNDELVKKALGKLAKATKSQTDAENSAYRDRAKERRQAFNQPKQPAAQHNKGQKDGTAQPNIPKVDDTPPPPSKGAALLGKMGWTAGEGLGAQGTGRTEAITTELYSRGVGLGAQGGKVGDAIEEAERSTRGSYADFVSKSKDKAKERFEKMA